MYSTDFSADLDSLISKLPQPAGYKILIAVAALDEKKGSVYLPENYQNLESTASIIGYVMRLGKDCYGDTAKFPNGPWCKEGDWISFRSYSGTRLKIANQEFRFLSDDQVESVIPDPKAIERAF